MTRQRGKRGQWAGGFGLALHAGHRLTAGRLLVGGGPRVCSLGSGWCGELSLRMGKCSILFCFLSEIRHKILSFISPINNY